MTITLNAVTEAITWAAVAGASGYKGAVSASPRGNPARAPVGAGYYELGTALTWTPPAAPGQTYYYGAAAEGLAGGDLWCPTRGCDHLAVSRTIRQR